MRLTRKLQMRDASWATIAVPTVVLRSPAWVGVENVSLQFDSQNPDIIVIQPATSVAGDDSQE